MHFYCGYWMEQKPQPILTLGMGPKLLMGYLKGALEHASKVRSEDSKF